MRYTVNFDCKTHHVGKDGKIPMLLRVSVNGQHDYINLGMRIKRLHYDEDNKCVKPGITGYGSVTAFITRQKAKIDKIVENFEKRNEIATVHRVKETYEKETGKVKSISFYGFVEDTIEYEKQFSDISPKTLDHYVDDLEKLKVFKPKLSIHDINKEFLDQYKTYLKDVLGQAKNTQYHALCFLRKYTKKLYDDGKISKYPFADYTVGQPHLSEVEHLTPNEISQLHALYDSGELTKIVRKSKSKYARYKEFPVGEKYQDVLRYFLVACYCGLRHSDIKTLCRQDIKGNYIVKEMQKGRLDRKKTVRIPIRKRLLSLLDLKNPNGLVFENPVMEDSQTNKYLKAIIHEHAGISKHITFHCSRHTFAVISLLLGIKIEVVSDILGHSELTTTQRYAKVVDELREKEMDKWDKLAKEEFNDRDCLVSCPACENTVMKFEKDIVKLNKIPLVCQHCSASFLFDLSKGISEACYKNSSGTV